MRAKSTWLAAVRRLLICLLALLMACSAVAVLPPETEHLIPFKILHTGLTLSRLEVCGCVANMMGGVSPRSVIIDEERAGVDRFLLMDSGRIFDASEEIDRRVAELYLQTMALMNYDAVLISETEFIFGADFIIEQIEKWQLPAVATNIVGPTDALMPWQPILTFEFPRLTVAVIGLVPPSPFVPAPYEVTDPIQAASEALCAIGNSADLIVALSSLPIADEQALLRQVPDIHLVLSAQAGRRHQRFYKTNMLHIEGEGGKIVNVVEANFKPSLPQMPFTFLVRPREVLPEGGVDPIVRDLVNDFYESVREESFATGEEFRLMTDQKVENLTGNEYVGSSSCEQCHATLYPPLRATNHASSMLSLLNKNRQFVPECLKCHTTGYGYSSGYRDFQAKGALAKVGCEVCHGPGKLHVQNPSNKDLIRRKVPDAICLQCHDAKNDPQFEQKAGERRKLILHRISNYPVPSEDR